MLSILLLVLLSQSVMGDYDLVGVVPQNTKFVVKCDQGLISKVTFALYGAIARNCSAPSTKTILEQLCVGKGACNVSVTDHVFNANRCPGQPKTLFAQLTCSGGRTVLTLDVLKKLALNTRSNIPVDQLEAQFRACDKNKDQVLVGSEIKQLVTLLKSQKGTKGGQEPKKTEAEKLGDDADKDLLIKMAMQYSNAMSNLTSPGVVQNGTNRSNSSSLPENPPAVLPALRVTDIFKTNATKAIDDLDRLIQTLTALSVEAKGVFKVGPSISQTDNVNGSIPDLRSRFNATKSTDFRLKPAEDESARQVIYIPSSQSRTLACPTNITSLDFATYWWPQGPGDKSTFKDNVNCTRSEQSALVSIRQQCLGKKECQVSNTPSQQDDCPGATKQISIAMECQKPTHTRTKK